MPIGGNPMKGIILAGGFVIPGLTRNPFVARMTKMDPGLRRDDGVPARCPPLRLRAFVVHTPSFWRRPESIFLSRMRTRGCWIKPSMTVHLDIRRGTPTFTSPRHSGAGQNPSSYRTCIPVDAGSSPA